MVNKDSKGLVLHDVLPIVDGNFSCPLPTFSLHLVTYCLDFVNWTYVYICSFLFVGLV